MSELTAGSLKKIMQGNKVETVVLVIKIEQFSSVETSYYKLLLFDGLNTTNYAIMSSEIYKKCGGQEGISEGSIINILEVKSKLIEQIGHVLIFIEYFELIRDGKLDVSLDFSNSAILSLPSVGAGVQQGNKRPHTEIASSSCKCQKVDLSTAAGPSRSISYFTPDTMKEENNLISSFGPNKKRGSIKAKVSGKSAIKKYANEQGKGQYFSFKLTDDEGSEIICTIFGDEALKRYDTIQNGKTYNFSECFIKKVNERYRTLHNNDYELRLYGHAEVTLCESESVTNNEMLIIEAFIASEKKAYHFTF